MLKKDELECPTSCLNKAADDEPIFVLRAHDELAPMVVRHWAMLAKASKVPHAKWSEAEHLAAKMEQWPNRKIPD